MIENNKETEGQKSTKHNYASLYVSLISNDPYDYGLCK